MAVKLAPIFNDAQLINGIPASGGLLFTYAAGSSSKLDTFTSSTGATAQANPIVLNSRGEPASPIWLTSGLSYKFVFAPSTDSDPPAAPIRTIDNVSGINDTTAPSVDQWQPSNVTPTYVSGTSFTLTGNQTAEFSIGRRVKCTVTAGTIYGSITNSVYGALTTVTVVNDSGSLDSGLSSVSYGLLTQTNPSYPVPHPVSQGGTGATTASGARSNLGFGAYGFAAYTTGTQSLTSGAAAAEVTFASESFDDGGVFASNTFTAPIAGVYTLNASIRFNSATLSEGRVYFYKNGAADQIGAAALTSAVNGSYVLTVSQVYKLAASDTIKIYAYVVGGTPTISGSGVSSSVFSGALLYPT